MHMEFEGHSRMDIEYGDMLIYMDIYSNMRGGEWIKGVDGG